MAVDLSGEKKKPGEIVISLSPDCSSYTCAVRGLIAPAAIEALDTVRAAISQPSAYTNRWIATITADAGKTITNAGLFNSTAGATLFIKGDFTGIVLASGDKIEFTISLQQT